MREDKNRSRRFRDMAKDHMLNFNNTAYLQRIAEKEAEAEDIHTFTRDLEKKEQFLVEKFSSTKAEES